MTEINCIEVPVDYSVAACARANPFHWALLKAVQSFPVGSRPSFSEIAERLHFHEPAFLVQAWTELCEDAAVSTTEFENTDLTEIGTEALRTGYILKSPIDPRRVTLVFSARGDRCIERREFEIVLGARLQRPPVWSNNLNLDAIMNAMSHQMPLQLPTDGERIIEFKILWEEAHEAVARW